MVAQASLSVQVDPGDERVVGGAVGPSRPEQVDAHRAVPGPGGAAPGRQRAHQGRRVHGGAAQVEQPTGPGIAPDLAHRLPLGGAGQLGVGRSPGRGRAVGQPGGLGQQDVAQLPEGGRLQVLEVQPAQQRPALLVGAGAAPVEQLVEVFPVLGEGGRAHGQEQRHLRGERAERLLLPHLLGGAAQEHEGAEVVGLGEQHVVFVLRDLGEDVGVAHHARHGADQVAHGGAEEVAPGLAPELLQVVDRHHQQRELPVVTARLVELLAGVVHEVGQVVGLRLAVPQPGALEGLEAAGVLQGDGGEVGHRQGRGVLVRPEATPGPVGEQGQPHRLLVDEQRHVEGLPLRRLRRQEGGAGADRGGQLPLPRIQRRREGPAIHQTAVAAQAEVPLLVGHPDGGALSVGDPRQHRQRQVLEPFQVEGGQQRGALPEDRLALHELEVLGEQGRVLAPEPPALEGALHHHLQLLPPHRLGEEVGAAGLHGSHRQPDVLVAGDGHRLQVGVAGLGLPHQLDPVQAGHDDVGEEQVEALAGEQPSCLVPGGSGAHRVAARRQYPLVEVAEESLVVDYEDAARRHARGWSPPGRPARRVP